jgi:hypothetical protein
LLYDLTDSQVIELYIRDYDAWTNQKKQQAAKRWIEELKRYPQFRNIPLKPRMVVAFIRCQERNFEKAIKRAQELKLPPPEPALRTDPFNSELEIEFITDPNMPKRPKNEIDRLCHYFNQMYHTLAPLHNLHDRIPSRTASPPPEIEDEEPTLEAIYFDSPSTARTSSPDTFRFSTPSSSLRSVSETPSLSDISLQIPRYGFPPIPAAGPFSTVKQGIGGGHHTVSPVARERQFSFHTPMMGRAPIPIPIPTERLAEPNKTLAFNVASLSGRFESLNFANGNLGNIDVTSHQSALPALLRNDSEINSRKRKRGRTSTPVPRVASLYSTVRDSGQRTRDAHRNARVAELETAISIAKGDIHVTSAKTHFARRRSAFSNMQEKDRLSHKERMGEMRSQLANLRRESESLGLFVDPLAFRCICDRILRLLGDIKGVVAFGTGKFISQASDFPYLAELQRDADYLIQHLPLLQNLSTSLAKDIRHTASQVVQLCRARAKLCLSPSSIPSKKCKADDPSLLKRRRLTARDDPKKRLKEWFQSHFSDPYPSKEEKMVLAKETGLRLREVSRWFSNTRLRINQGNHTLLQYGC